MNKRSFWVLSMLLILGVFLIKPAFSYPPAVGLLGKAKNCLVCHVNNGPWQD